jgi:predicted nucleic acid-binding protein
MIIVDTGPLYAYVDRDDRHHSASLDLLRRHPGPLVVPTLCIAEVAYFIEKRLDAATEIRFLGDVAAGLFRVEPVHPADWLRIADLVARYRDLPLGTVDAAAIACAERLGITRVATVDVKHFSAVRPSHVPAFDLVL